MEFYLVNLVYKTSVTTTHNLFSTFEKAWEWGNDLMNKMKDGGYMSPEKIEVISVYHFNGD